MRALLATAVAAIALLAFRQGTAAAEGCLYQDEVVSASNQARAVRSCSA